MEEIRNAVPWPIVNVSTVSKKTYMVLPGITFSHGVQKNGTDIITANYSGHEVVYRGKENLVFFVSALKRIVESEKKRQNSSEVVQVLLKSIEQLEKERDKYKQKYEMVKGAIEFAPGSQEYEDAKKRFYENI